MDRTIQQHINDVKNELDSGSLSPQRKRHIQSELEQLQNYRERHPDDVKDPTPFELYCDENPDALECRIYEE
jgi:hypothetical protein